MAASIKYQLPHGKVLARLDDPSVFDTLGFDQSGMFVDEHNRKSCTGEIVAVCDKLGFFEFDADDPYLGYDEIEKAQSSPAYNVPIEVEVGDRVMFAYTALLHEESFISDDTVVVDYDRLVLRLDSDGAYPLNGLIIMEAVDEQYAVGSFEVTSHGMINSMTTGVVIAQGVHCQGYAGEAKHYYPHIGNVVGKQVLYVPKMAIRIEDDQFRKMGGDKYSLYKIEQRYIRLIKK